MWPDKSLYHSSNNLKLLEGAENFFPVLQDCIKQAKKEIHFQTYIFADDSTGKSISESLIKAAKRGVKVFLILDAYGSNFLSKEFVTNLIDNGISLKWFSPTIFKKKANFGRRLHHKVVVIDKKIAIVGGINIADRYKGTKNNPPWLDYSVLIKGPVVKEIYNRCIELWNRKIILKKRKRKKHYHKEIIYPLIKVNINDYLQGHKREITLSYKRAFRNAKNKIIILSAYFIPGITVRRLLKEARTRGVEVIVLSSVSSDIKFVQFASKYLYSWILKHNIKIYEWKPSVLHAKVAIVDDYWVTIGSYNLNYLSEYISVELNVEILDPNNNGFTKLLLKNIENKIKNECDEINLMKYYKQNNVFIRALEWISYYLFRYSMKLLFFLSKRI